MFEKVNPSHPDKLADRIAGAIVDLAYSKQDNPKIAVEVLLGHGKCTVMIESSVEITWKEVRRIVDRITGEKMMIDCVCVSQDEHLAENQSGEVRCGDNGIFKGVPLTEEQKKLSEIARKIYREHPFDGKYILDGDKLIICQSNASTEALRKEYPNAKINPLGDWTGGSDVDCGATNRKLGSDMGDSITGGGLHGKDLSKADVSVNIYAWVKAQNEGKTVEISCGIGDNRVDGRSYKNIVRIARDFINATGGFEKFAEWGLV